MRIFVLGAGATGSLLAQLLERQGHTVWCGDRDPERARRFLGKKSTIAVTPVNARNLRGIVKAAKGCQLIVNASASVFNEIVLRAALRLRAHYVDLSSHLMRHPFRAEQFRYVKKFEGKNRVALINAGVAPGLTNLLVKRAAELLDEVEAVHIRLYESSESDDPISQWSPEVSFDEAKDSAMPAEGLAKYRDEAPHEEPMLADGAWAAIGGLWTSPRDYARWVAFQLAAWPPRDSPDEGPVRRASLRETQSLQRFNGVDAWRDPKGELRVYGGGYGMGWGVSANCRFEQVITHSGGLPGYGSRVLLLPDRGVGVFTMTNLTYTSGGSAAIELIEALDDQGLIPKRPQPVSPHLEAARAKVLSLLAHFDQAEAGARIRPGIPEL